MHLVAVNKARHHCVKEKLSKLSQEPKHRGSLSNHEVKPRCECSAKCFLSVLTDELKTHQNLLIDRVIIKYSQTCTVKKTAGTAQ